METYWTSEEPKPDKPVLMRTILYDFTPETMMQADYYNPRNVTILTDEIMGIFKFVNRYTSGPLIEQLLSAWSGTPIDVIRWKSDTFSYREPMHHYYRHHIGNKNSRTAKQRI